MYPKTLVLLFLISIVTLTSGSAQDVKDVPPPTAPFLAAVPKNVDWTLALKYPTTSTPADSSDPQIAEVHSSKVEKLKRDLVRYLNGTVKEVWYYESFLFWKDARGDVSVSELSSDTARSLDDINPAVASGFPGVRWVSLTTYKGVVPFDKVPSYYYANGSTEAWIDVKSKLPLAYKSGDILYQYKFDPNPPTSLTLPSDYKEAWDKVQSLVSAQKQLKKVLEQQ